jgi:hypothetical protein
MTQSVKSILIPLVVLSSLWTTSCVRDETETKSAAEMKSATIQKPETGLKPGVPTAHTTRMAEGWTIRVDDRLLKGEHAATG